MVLPLLPIAAGALLLKGKKGMGSFSPKKLLNVSSGPASNVVKGLGVGTIANVIDKKFTGGMLTRYGIGFGQSINGKPLTVNVTDIVTYYATTGGLKFSKKDLITGGIAIAAKKIGEAYDYIDPPFFAVPSSISSMNRGFTTGAVSPGMINSSVPNLKLVS